MSVKCMENRPRRHFAIARPLEHAQQSAKQGHLYAMIHSSNPLMLEARQGESVLNILRGASERHLINKARPSGPSAYDPVIAKKVLQSMSKPEIDMTPGSKLYRLKWGGQIPPPHPDLHPYIIEKWFPVCGRMLHTPASGIYNGGCHSRF